MTFIKIEEAGADGVEDDMDKFVYTGGRVVQDGPAEFYTI
ncbi:hypothetical protein AGMMS49940_01300 [Spirochaetia bacterium]|nr:hypothetical protein AGMMS49940_01300 [Spirochaetia bacterium]